MIVTFGEMLPRLQPPGYLRPTQTRSLDVTFGGGEANEAITLRESVSASLNHLLFLYGFENMQRHLQNGAGILFNDLVFLDHLLT